MRDKVIELVRWLGVLPASVGGWFLGKTISRVLYWLISIGGTVNLREMHYPDFLLVLLFYPPKSAAFVVLGALMAPRFRTASAVVLAILTVLLSLQIHVTGQRNPGSTNYMHFSTESLGAVCGAAGIAYFVARSKRCT